MYTLTSNAGLNTTVPTIAQAAAALAQHLHDMTPDGPVHWTTTTPSGTTHTGHLRLNGLPDNVFTVGVVCFAATAKPASRVPRPRHTCRGMVGTFIATLTPRPGVRTISP